MTDSDYIFLETDRLILRVLRESSAENVLSFLENGREVFEKYEATRVPLFYTVKFQAKVLESEWDAFTKKLYLRYYIFLKSNPDVIIGTVSFGNLMPDPYQCCTIGYKISPGFQNLGYGKEGIGAAVKSAFSFLKVHRIEAFVQTNNESSIHVLENCGFEREGLCRKNLHVNGVWTDHYLYGLLNES